MRNKNLYRSAFWQQFVYLFFFLLSLGGFLEVNAAGQEEIKQFILKAMDFTYFSSFTTPDLQMQIKGKPATFVFYSFGKSNKELYARYERDWSSSGIAIFVRNPQGDFFWRESGGNVIANTVIKSELPINAFAGFTILTGNLLFGPDGSSGPRYSMSGYSIRKGISSRKITVKYPANDETLVRLRKMSMSDFAALPENQKDAFRRNTYSTFELKVGRADFPFIYSYRCYNILGEEVFSVDFGRPEIIAFQESFFKVPDASVKEAKDQQEFKKIAKKKYSYDSFAATILGCLKGVWSFIVRAGLFFLEYGHVIMLTIATISIVGIILLKWKTRNR